MTTMKNTVFRRDEIWFQQKMKGMKGRYEQMLQVLKEYDEDIISINYDDNERRIGKGTYKILSKSNKKALPLNVYGDGMKKQAIGRML